MHAVKSSNVEHRVPRLTAKVGLHLVACKGHKVSRGRYSRKTTFIDDVRSYFVTSRNTSIAEYCAANRPPIERMTSVAAGIPAQTAAMLPRPDNLAMAPCRVDSGSKGRPSYAVWNTNLGSLGLARDQLQAR